MSSYDKSPKESTLIESADVVKLNAEIKELREKLKKAEEIGAQKMLMSIRASVNEYPYGGGDIEIMERIEYLITEAKRSL